MSECCEMRLSTTLARTFEGETPAAIGMDSVGSLALIANLTRVLIPLRWRDGDSNVRSVWLCSRNDAIGNVGVIAVAGLVAVTGSHWPDLFVALILASLFLRSAWLISRRASLERHQLPTG